jgi:hypothetical protein
MNVAKVRANDTRLILLVFNECAEREWARNREGPGGIRHEQSQEGEKRIFVIVTESGETAA